MSKKIIILNLIIMMLLLLQLHISLADDNDVILEIFDIRPEQVVRKGFTLDKDMEIEIDAMIGILKDSDYLLSACWILNAESRDLAWECSVDNSSKDHHRNELKCKQKLYLSKGNYEAYYALNPSHHLTFKGISDFLDNIFSGFKSRAYSPEWGVTIKTSQHKSALQFVHEYLPSKDEQAVVQITATHDNLLKKKGFSISKPLKVRIYAIGEGAINNRQMYDYGWIIDANSRKRIWEMNRRNIEHAGGATKNKMVDEIITLPAGNYLVYFVTDDSHSPRRWNQIPPYDPFHWGITIWGMETDWDGTVAKEYREYEPEPILEINHVRNNRFEMEGFTLKSEANLQIYALGEYSRSGHRFVDYGWIVNAHSREIVWQMEYSNTEYAGGHEKNRVFDDIVFFPAGSYLVYYVSDESHAYKHWNTSPPYQPAAWGIAIYPIQKEFSFNNVEQYNEEGDKDILAQIIQVRNNESLTANFSLIQPTKIRIYAIGEGDRDEMYDYGWIEDVTGNIVWEMNYRDSYRAGGAKKNRLVNKVISLEQGTYIVHYKTDDSHSYRQWNSTPPNDRIHWGITIIKSDTVSYNQKH